MAHAHFVKKARRTYRGTGIKKGMSYWWWKFRRGALQRSLTQPRPSQLTQSAFWSSYLSSTEAFEDAIREAATMTDLQSARDDLKQALEELRDETEESKSNMPDSLQEGSTGELMQERIDGLEEFIQELEGVEIPDEEESESDEEDEDTEPEAENNLEDSRQELQGLSGYSGS